MNFLFFNIQTRISLKTKQKEEKKSVKDNDDSNAITKADNLEEVDKETVDVAGIRGASSSSTVNELLHGLGRST